MDHIFTALARVKKSKYEKTNGEENKIIDLFLATTGSEAVKKLSTLAYSREFENIYLWKDC